ncbi:hypothetical protein AYJ57_20100 [Salipiger sp. CCB-MM3]|uniref:hypothetical protein n=1 Tax=Salipiger sp. CCB-MM3 TaxID=1792508 RepID=UPI00080ABD1C|nr:hypothetical protein [Salipiger sp. CCB-MM3]ANT62679.1 hypothetical protein AYJ57_20100 [Salipiger sp. CCB-MM3]
MSTLQLLSHPGPRAEARFAALPCRAQPVEIHLAAGQSFERAVVQGFAEAGFSAGYLRLADIAFERLTYVIPAPAPGDGRAAWYSKTYVLERAEIAEAGLHLGMKDGAPFLHCHGLWSGAGGPLRMGHLLAAGSVLAEAVTMSGWGITGAALEVTPDAETGFDLFAPRAVGEAGSGHPALLCTLRPNEDPHSLLPQLAGGMERARIEGIGSLVNTRFETGTLESYATEMLLRAGRLTGESVILNAASVGFDGTPMSGVLRPHENRICITAELLLIEDPAT